MIIMIILPLCPFAFFLHLSCFRIRHTHTHTCMDQAFSFLFLTSFNLRVSSDLLCSSPLFLLIEPI